MNPNNLTTGEQVAQQIWANSLSGASREVQFKAAVKAINAALADANDMWDRASRQADTLAEYLVDAKADLAVAQQQLADEREKVERMSKAYMVCNQDWQDVTAQLALTEAHARQLSKIPVEQTYENLAWKDFQQLKQQLAAAVEALKKARIKNGQLWKQKIGGKT